MKNIIEKIKTKRIFVLITISILSLIFIFFKINSNKKKVIIKPIPTTISTAEYKGLIPGSSTKDEVIEKLGTALNAKIEDSKETYEYRSSNQNFNSKVVIVNDKLSYLKLIYTMSDNIKYTDFINKYREPEKVLYGSDYSVGYILNSYPNIGLAFLSHKKSGNVREVWYFIPTSLEDFIRNYAPGYSERVEIVQ